MWVDWQIFQQIHIISSHIFITTSMNSFVSKSFVYSIQSSEKWRFFRRLNFPSVIHFIYHIYYIYWKKTNITIHLDPLDQFRLQMLPLKYIRKTKLNFASWLIDRFYYLHTFKYCNWSINSIVWLHWSQVMANQALYWWTRGHYCISCIAL
jgi:hypothetical protein